MTRLKEIVGEKSFEKLKLEVADFLGLNKDHLDVAITDYANQKQLTTVMYAMAYKYNKNEAEKRELLTKIYVNSK